MRRERAFAAVVSPKREPPWGPRGLCEGVGPAWDRRNYEVCSILCRQKTVTWRPSSARRLDGQGMRGGHQAVLSGRQIWRHRQLHEAASRRGQRGDHLHRLPRSRSVARCASVGWGEGKNSSLDWRRPGKIESRLIRAQSDGLSPARGPCPALLSHERGFFRAPKTTPFSSDGRLFFEARSGTSSSRKPTRPISPVKRAD
jgi:hypothetical protein